MLNVAPQKERIPDHLRAMAEQDDKSAASGKTGEQSSIGVGCAPGEERDAAISICAVHSTTVTAAIAEFCEDTVEKQKTLACKRDMRAHRVRRDRRVPSIRLRLSPHAAIGKTGMAVNSATSSTIGACHVAKLHFCAPA